MLEINVKSQQSHAAVFCYRFGVIVQNAITFRGGGGGQGRLLSGFN